MSKIWKIVVVVLLIGITVVGAYFISSGGYLSGRMGKYMDNRNSKIKLPSPTATPTASPFSTELMSPTTAVGTAVTLEEVQVADCTDTDGGINTSVKGTVTYNTAIYRDSCLATSVVTSPVSTGAYIRENYCTAEGKQKYIVSECNCSEGQCL